MLTWYVNCHNILISSLAIQSEDHGLAGGVGAGVAVLIIIIVIVFAITVITVVAIKFHLKAKCPSKSDMLINLTIIFYL